MVHTVSKCERRQNNGQTELPGIYNAVYDDVRQKLGQCLNCPKITGGRGLAAYYVPTPNWSALIDQNN